MLLQVMDFTVTFVWMLEQKLKKHRASRLAERTLIIIDRNKVYDTSLEILGALYANQSGIMTLPEVAQHFKHPLDNREKV